MKLPEVQCGHSTTCVTSLAVLISKVELKCVRNLCLSDVGVVFVCMVYRCVLCVCVVCERTGHERRRNDETGGRSRPKTLASHFVYDWSALVGSHSVRIGTLPPDRVHVAKAPEGVEVLQPVVRKEALPLGDIVHLTDRRNRIHEAREHCGARRVVQAPEIDLHGALPHGLPLWAQGGDRDRICPNEVESPALVRDELLQKRRLRAKLCPFRSRHRLGSPRVRFLLHRGSGLAG